jgi:hypothetical protein
MEKEKNLILKVRKSLKAETVDQKALHLKNTIKKEEIILRFFSFFFFLFFFFL